MIRFLKNKDLILRRIIDIAHKKDDNLIIVNMNGGITQALVVEPFLEKSRIDSILKKLSGYEVCSIVCYNTQDNFNAVVESWPVLAKFKRNFSINFINPFSRTEKRWVVYPQTHDLISEKMKQSLKILASNVETTTKKEIEKVVL
ncbi:MAG: hypothetical protein KKE20_00105 [Nanoarchaeota archaeon]|nr:hypothetical protein [Nanoarchaeota archaeon]